MRLFSASLVPSQAGYAFLHFDIGNSIFDIFPSNRLGLRGPRAGCPCHGLRPADRVQHVSRILENQDDGAGRKGVAIRIISNLSAFLSSRYGLPAK
jgi:hypothetical protein